ncbi:MAG: hypothetical protein HWN65_14780 [Candidatus Helarchaeota archaeon]|nr:hypothetical protein [Candidatus Helarchaeota archaeon]
MEKTCRKCKKEVLVSNLIGEQFCLFCFGKVIRGFRKAVAFFKFFASFYRFTPIIAGALALTAYLLAIPFVITILTFVLLFVCMFGALPYMFPFITAEFQDDIAFNYEQQLNKYTPGTQSYCVNHPTRDSIGRCSICLEPFCSEDFYFQIRRIYWKTSEFPAYCIKCGKKFMDTNMFPIIYGGLTIGGLFIIDLLLSGFSMLTIIFGILIFVVLFGIPLALTGMKRNLYLKQP